MKKLLLILVVALLLPINLVISAEIQGIFGGGSFQTADGWHFASFVGGNVPIVSTETFKSYTRTQYLYVDSPTDIQGFSLWQMNEKYIGLWKLYLAGGIGLNYQITDQDDITNAGMKGELG